MMRVQESKNIRLNAEIMATAALSRTETRTRSAHRRLDYPETDNTNWRKFVVVEQGAGGAPAVHTLDTSVPLSATFHRNSTGASKQRTEDYAAAR
jgi:succinate dehydrogenase/fumarate reductase flavoprotein subunit